MSSPIDNLHKLGQSLWYDNIRRQMLEDGRLATLIERGELRGMTSNPSIFNQAIAHSNDYDVALTTMAWAGSSSEEILDRLVMEDIRQAADLFFPLFRDTDGGDGYVSVEVSPTLAHDTEGTLAEARRLWDLIDRPNLMVKIPATQAGLPAIRRAIAAGINVNITLIFSLTRYAEVMDAYLSGLEDRLVQGQPLKHIASVASFFVSRIDSKVDRHLEMIIRTESGGAERAARLLGKLAVANARLAYAQFKQVFQSERFNRLAEKGAGLQRPLWASTSTKNPAYSETKYVDELIGPDSVNTVPPSTLDAFRQHGTARLTIEENLDKAQAAFDELESMGISMARVTEELEVEGVQAFADAYHDLLNTIEIRRKEALHDLGPLAHTVKLRVESFKEQRLTQRLWEKDASLWTEDPEGQKEISNRLGWLDLPQKSRVMVDEVQTFAEEVQASGFTHALLLGMGGSSLAPEVMSLIFSSTAHGQTGEGLDLAILDSTDPAQVLEAAGRSPVESTLYIVSSKSGGTAEVNAFLAYFWDLAQERVGDKAGNHFIAITDPGTSLNRLAKERNFRRVFLADPEVGGRYSALTVFGLVPAALMNINLERLLDRAGWMLNQSRANQPVWRNPGVVLGAILGEAALNGRDKLTLVSEPAIEPFGAWLEQLVAESSGKDGKGIIPVDREPLASPDMYGSDRLFIHFRLNSADRSLERDQALAKLKEAGHPVLTVKMIDLYDTGAEFYRFGLATAVACTVIGVNAFDQPDVQDNKNRTLEKVKLYKEQRRLDEGKVLWEGVEARLYGGLVGAGFSPEPGTHNFKDLLASFLRKVEPNDYVALNAYLPRNTENEAALGRLRVAVWKLTRSATMVGFGPRFLHSTGQLHKGGPNRAHFLLITVDPQEGIEIPGENMTFGVLQRAQALGDIEALEGRDRRALRIHLPSPAGLLKLVETFESL
jgi:transaldolase / glucose-6-phosphate isomerase